MMQAAVLESKRQQRCTRACSTCMHASANPAAVQKPTALLQNGSGLYAAMLAKILRLSPTRMLLCWPQVAGRAAQRPPSAVSVINLHRPRCAGLLL